jgi:hypothetical protein
MGMRETYRENRTFLNGLDNPKKSLTRIERFYKLSLKTKIIHVKARTRFSEETYRIRLAGEGLPRPEGEEDIEKGGT